MAGRLGDKIKGITIEIDGSTSKLSGSLKKLDKDLISTQSQLKDVNKLLKFDDSNSTVLLSQKQGLLATAIDQTKEKLQALYLADEQAKQQLADGTITQAQYDALQREIIETEQKLKGLETQAESVESALSETKAQAEATGGAFGGAAADADGLQKELKGIDQSLDSTKSQLKEVDKLLKLDPSNTELVNQKQRLLADAISQTKEKVDLLRTADEQAKQQLESGDMGQAQYDALQRAIIETELELKELENVDAQAKQQLASVDGAGAQFSSLNGDIRQTGQELKEVESSAKSAALGVGDIATAIGLVKIASSAIGSLKSMLSDATSSATSRIDTMEQFERTMTTMTGSTQAAKEALEATRGTVTGTAYGLDVAAKSVQSFTTAGKDIKKSTKDIEGLADAVSFYGDGTNASLDSVSNAWSKMITSGRVYSNDVQTLLSAGIPAYKIYADAVGRSVEDIQADLSSGAISAESFQDTLIDAFQNGTAGFESIAGAAQNAGASWQGTIDNMKAYAARGMTNMLENIDEGLQKADLPTIREMISNVGAVIENTLTDVGEKIPILIAGVKEFYESIKPFLPIIVALVAAVVAFETALKIQSTIQAVQGAFMGLNTVMMANPIALIIAAIAALVAMFIYLWNTSEEFRQFWIELWGSITAIMTDFDSFLQSVFSVDWTEHFGSMGVVLNNFFAMVSGIWDSIKQIFHGIIEFVSGVFTGDWSRAWEGVKTIFGGIMSGLGEVIKTPLNAVISLVNAAISGLNKISVSVPDWVPAFGGKTFGFDIPKIQYLAKGGIVRMPTPTITGEDGAEAIIPLERNTSGMKMIAGMLVEQMKGNQALSSAEGLVFYHTTHNVFAIDGKEMIRETAKETIRLINHQQANKLRGRGAY